MKIKSDDLLSIHIPRWNEFPVFELYIDQVVAFINENLEIFHFGSTEPMVTASMINNYVKNGVLHPPIRKKYDRTHLAKLVVVCICKRMTSIADIRDCISAMMRVFDIAEGYDIFCDEVEYEVHSAAFPGSYPLRTTFAAETREVATVRTLASAVARLLLFDRILCQRRRLGNVVAAMVSDGKTE